MLGKDKKAINILAEKFKNEKALYTRLVISQSLSNFGIITIPTLVSLLGQIGNNQEDDLPKKYFSKKSFPLPRDLVSRAIVKCGEIATPFLIDVLESDTDDFIKQQVIDAIGSIAYKYNDHRALNSLIKFSDKLLKLRNQNINIEDLKSNNITIGS